MRESPPRLSRLTSGPMLPRLDAAPITGDSDLWPFGGSEHPHHVMRRIRAIRRALIAVLWTLPLMPIQAILLLLPGRGKVMLARIYWATLARVLGLTVRVIGSPAGGDGCFVAKSEVSRWPLVGTIARMGRTAFVSRRRGATLSERDSMRGRLAAGDNLILFPEGTTSDGSRVMPFRSTFFAVAEGEHPPLIQPVSVVYDRLAGLPTGRASRPLFAWYGDMDIASHYWRLAQHCGLRATVLLHTPLDPAQFPNRKALSLAVWGAVADGAATLRQNRPAQPLSVTAEATPTIDEATPAYA
jgi:1-acyl-sn-glycerol-3-phosphate acyltransferase